MSERQQMIRIHGLERKFLLVLASLSLMATACQIGAFLANVTAPLGKLLILGSLASGIITVTTLMAYRSLGKWLDWWRDE